MIGHRTLAESYFETPAAVVWIEEGNQISQPEKEANSEEN
jgi:hypothetical protein